nr:hypothetical protein PFCWREHM_PFCWREHM_CDS_0012 [Microvirus sp.]
MHFCMFHVKIKVKTKLCKLKFVIIMSVMLHISKE